MSCWCDGDDPGCETCRPHLTPEQRVEARAAKKVRDAGPELLAALLAAPLQDGVGGIPKSCGWCGHIRGLPHKPVCRFAVALTAAGLPVPLVGGKA